MHKDLPAWRTPFDRRWQCTHSDESIEKNFPVPGTAALFGGRWKDQSIQAVAPQIPFLWLNPFEAQGRFVGLRASWFPVRRPALGPQMIERVSCNARSRNALNLHNGLLASSLTLRAARGVNGAGVVSRA